MGKTILVADDSRTIRRAVELTFRFTDFQVVSVDSADQALKSIAEIRPDLILADASMPGTDGYSLCNTIKSNATSARIPVVLLASKFDPFDAGRGKEAQADGHIDKPWETQSLIDMVKSKIGMPIDNGGPQSFAATLAKRNEKGEGSKSAPTNGQQPALASPFGAPIPSAAPVAAAAAPISAAAAAPISATAAAPIATAPAASSSPVAAAPAAAATSERVSSRAAPSSRPPPLAASPKSAPSHVTRGAGMGGSLDDVVIEEPVDDPVGPSLEPPPPPRRNRPKVDVWALDEEVERSPDAGPPPGADDPIEDIAIDDVPMEDSTPPPEIDRAPMAAKIASAAAPAVAKAVQPMAPGIPNDQMVALAREIIERIAWEVVPELAETIIRAELARLLADKE